MMDRCHSGMPNLSHLAHTGPAGFSLPGELVSLGIGRGHVVRKPIADMKIFPDSIDKLLNKNDVTGQTDRCSHHR